MGPVGFREMSVQDYHFTLRNSPEEGRFHLEAVYNCVFNKKELCLGAIYWQICL
jgi:hypothetical protein